MSDKKKVLIVDDIKTHITDLLKYLDESRFKVLTADNEKTARELAEAHWETLDVIVLDNELDRNDRTITGPGIAIEYREKKRSFPPESIIFSKFSEIISYYKLAIKLGAAAYLGKDDLSLVADHVKVLALCRALNPANPKLVGKLARIAAHSKTEADAILTFCGGVLKDELDSCLGVPFVVLFTQGDHTQNCASNINLPIDSSVYQELQDVANANLTGPTILDSYKLTRPKDQAANDLHSKVNRAVLLPLSSSENLKLTICILHDNTASTTKRSDNESLCKVLSQYFRPTVFANITNIWSQWAELHATRISTAKLCLAVGQEISYGLKDRKQLEDLANDLSNTGQYLTQLDNRNAFDKVENFSVEAVVTSAWEDVAPSPKDRPEIKPPEVKGDCTVRAQKGDLELIFSRLLQWFVYRTQSMPLDVKPAIIIDCENTEAGATITFEDNSHRLPKKLREDLFAPFTQAISTPFPKIGTTKGKVKKRDLDSTDNHLNTGRYLPLYLAKMLVEGRYHGVLEDQSDEIKEYNYGHRILMQFPSISEQDLN